MKRLRELFGRHIIGRAELRRSRAEAALATLPHKSYYAQAEQFSLALAEMYYQIGNAILGRTSKPR